MDTIVNAGAIAYGLLLVIGTFLRHPVTEALRIDTLFIPKASDSTRLLNALMGVLIAGYGLYGLWHH